MRYHRIYQSTRTNNTRSQTKVDEMNAVFQIQRAHIRRRTYHIAHVG